MCAIFFSVKEIYETETCDRALDKKMKYLLSQQDNGAQSEHKLDNNGSAELVPDKRAGPTRGEPSVSLTSLLGRHLHVSLSAPVLSETVR